MTLNDRLYRLLRLPMPVLSLRTIVIVAALSVIAVVITIGTWVWIGVTNDQYSQLDRRLDSLSSLGDVSALLGSAPHTDTGQPAPDRNLVRTVRVGDITASMPSDIVLPALPAGYADTTINGVPYRVRTVTAGPAGEADCSAGDVYRDNRQWFGLDGHAAFLAAFAFDVHDRSAVVGSADVADVSLGELVCPQAGQQCGEDECEISFSPVCLAL